MKLLLAVALLTFVQSGLAHTYGQEKRQTSVPMSNAPETLSAAAKSAAMEQELTALEQELANAFMRRDRARLQSILAEDFVYTNSSSPADVMKKEQFIENSLAVKIESFRFSETAVRWYAGTAIMSTLYTQTIKAANKERNDDFFLTDVWLKRDGRWQMAARYSSRVERDGPQHASEQSRRVNKIDPKIYDDYAGQYELSPGLILTITREGDRLISQINGQQKIELLPNSESEFFVREFDGQLTFVKDGKGQVTHILLFENGKQQRARKTR